MNLEHELQQHYGSLQSGADFDARVLARIASVARPAGDPAARRAAELAKYSQTRKSLAREWLMGMGWIAVFGILAMLVAPHVIPVATELAQASARTLRVAALPGVSIGELLLLVALAAWFAANQPRIASRW